MPSGFKTPTAMSPPKVQAKSPSITMQSSSKMSSTTGAQQSPNRTGAIFPYDVTPGLMQAFEELKLQNPQPPGSAHAPKDELLQHSASIRGGNLSQQSSAGVGIASSVTSPTSKFCRDDPTNSKSLAGRLSIVSVPIISTKMSSDAIERDRPNTAPVRMHERHQAGFEANIAEAAALDSLSRAYGRMSDFVGGSVSSEKPLPQPPSCPDLEVYKRHESNGRLMVCEAREQHCSNTVIEFVGERTGLRDIAELRAELMNILGHLGKGGQERARADLKVVTGNMLERVVAWDLNRAEVLEQPDVPLLSTVPTAASLNKVDAMYIIKTFRLGMQKIPSEDVRSKIGRLPDQDLTALLHFTLLISRPILAWELDLDEI